VVYLCRCCKQHAALCQLYAVCKAVYARYSVEIKARHEKKTDRGGKNHVCISLHGAWGEGAYKAPKWDARSMMT
jgi:hypothetical protein